MSKLELNDEEVAIASHAVAARREDLAAAALLDDLSDRERIIARQAWARARKEILRSLLREIGPASVTVDAALLREALQRVPFPPRFERRHDLRFAHPPDELELAKDVREWSNAPLPAPVGRRAS